MIVRNNYQECLTNLACSIRKYFNLPCSHNSLPMIDEILNREKPENVIVMLFDGMGSLILDRALDKDSFFNKNRIADITSVFPATTTAATTSIRTGLNPCEHGWLGWNTYIPTIGKVITLFTNTEKETKELVPEFIETKKDILYSGTITEEINKNVSNAYSKEFFPFGNDPYTNLDDMLERVEKETKVPGKKYLYAYDPEPDTAMHIYGTDSDAAKNLIRERNDKVEALCNRLDNSVIFVIADHGHINVNRLFLTDYPEIMELLERPTASEQRALIFKIKDGCHELFEERFNKLFKDYYDLYTKEDVINSKLYGDGVEIKLFREAIGDYLAIAKSNYSIVTPGDQILVSQHAGYTDDEIYIPIIYKSLVKK